MHLVPLGPTIIRINSLKWKSRACLDLSRTSANSISSDSKLPESGLVDMNVLLDNIQKPIKMGGCIVRHARQIVLQLVEMAVPRELF